MFDLIFRPNFIFTPWFFFRFRNQLMIKDKLLLNLKNAKFDRNWFMFKRKIWILFKSGRFKANVDILSKFMAF